MSTSRRQFIALATATMGGLMASSCGNGDPLNPAVAIAEDNGLVVARQPFILTKDQGEKFFLNGPWELTTRVTPTDSLGKFEFYDFLIGGRSTVAYHVHNRMDETITVLDGEIEFFIGDKKEVHTAGATAFIPMGVNHGFTALGPAHVQLLFTPATGQDEFFRRLMQLQADPAPLNQAVLDALLAEFDQVLVPPPDVPS